MEGQYISDTSRAKLSTGALKGGFIVFIEGNERVSPIVWLLKKLERVTESPFILEAMAFTEAAVTGYLVASLLQEVLGAERRVAANLYSDRKSLEDHLYSSSIISDFRFRVDIARLQEMLN